MEILATSDTVLYSRKSLIQYTDLKMGLIAGMGGMDHSARASQSEGIGTGSL